MEKENKWTDSPDIIKPICEGGNTMCFWCSIHHFSIPTGNVMENRKKAIKAPLGVVQKCLIPPAPYLRLQKTSLFYITTCSPLSFINICLLLIFKESVTMLQ